MPNAIRDPKKKQRPFHPADFHPYQKGWKRPTVPKTKDLSILKYVRRFKVDAGIPTARPNQILALADLPLPFERHPGDPRALADQPEVRQDEDNPQLWEVTIPYSSKIDDPEESDLHG